MPSPIVGPGAQALATLSAEQIAFIQSLPKAELHAHLNGSIPISVLQDLARDHLDASSASESLPDSVIEGIARLQAGVELNEIHEFFALFPAIYALTSTPIALARATRAVLHHFLEGEHPQCTYLELRSTPRVTDAFDRRGYLYAVLDEVEKYAPEQAALIVSLDRRMPADVARECIDIAIELKNAGRRVVGVDLCGDPKAGDMGAFLQLFADAKHAGLGITLHIAETSENPTEETLQLLSAKPDRLGHATFLNEEAKSVVEKNGMCIEICLTSNLLCKTVKTLDDHHIRYHLENKNPVVICTDDVLPFRNSLLGEYALLLASPPFGLGLAEEDVKQIAATSMRHRFGVEKA